ncbi:MAG: GNAT family N-acetyltransferase [Pseudomonadota bacterium]
MTSDLAALGPAARFEIHADRIVARTPDLPDYWTGNVVIFRIAAVDPVPQIACFHRDFPDAAHVALVWDDPHATLGPEHAALGEAGFDVNLDDVLTRHRAPSVPPPPDGIRLRACRDDADWEVATALQIETGLEEGYDPNAHPVFVAEHMALRRRHARAGGLRWFGAFDGGTLVADLGVVATDRIVRFQDVETRASHRRRGIAAALLAHASTWAARTAPHAVQVIVAEAGGSAGRFYRRLGFVPTERIASAVRGRYGRDG